MGMAKIAIPIDCYSFDEFQAWENLLCQNSIGQQKIERRPLDGVPRRNKRAPFRMPFGSPPLRLQLWLVVLSPSPFIPIRIHRAQKKSSFELNFHLLVIQRDGKKEFRFRMVSQLPQELVCQKRLFQSRPFLMERRKKSQLERQEHRFHRQKRLER